MANKKLFFKGSLKDKWFEFKYSLSMLKAFFWHIWWFRKYDFTFILDVLKKAIELQREGQHYYDPESQKVKQMDRVIELLNNAVEENYDEACGYNWEYVMDLKELEDGSYEIVDNQDDDLKESNSVAFEKAQSLERKETKELFTSLENNIKSWWY